MSTISFRNLADKAPSTKLWSVVKLKFIMGLIVISLFMTTALSAILFIPKIATSGLLMMGVNESMPNMPMFVIVNVPPVKSSGFNWFVLAFSMSFSVSDEIVMELDSIERKIGSNINPAPDKVLRFMQCNLDDIKVVILGQDPYPEKGKATGRAFEVGDLVSWNQKFRQVSLKNIIRLIHKDYNGITEYKDIKKFSQIQKEIEEGKFFILPPNEIFESWEKQGVLLLNTYLSVEAGISGSHISIWESFSRDLLKFISEENRNISWFLWGKMAEDKKRYIKYGKFYTSRHPMMCSELYEDDFLRSKCFKDTMTIINWKG
jgi:uracil-DNA glycosylase